MSSRLSSQLDNEWSENARYFKSAASKSQGLVTRKRSSLSTYHLLNLIKNDSTRADVTKEYGRELMFRWLVRYVRLTTILAHSLFFSFMDLYQQRRTFLITHLFLECCINAIKNGTSSSFSQVIQRSYRDYWPYYTSYRVLFNSFPHDLKDVYLDGPKMVDADCIIVSIWP